MADGVALININPHLVAPSEAPKHCCINVENRLVSARVEQSPQVVPVEVLEVAPNQRQHLRSILAPKVCKRLMWLQLVTTTIMCMIWYLITNLK